MPRARVSITVNRLAGEGSRYEGGEGGDTDSIEFSKRNFVLQSTAQQ